MKKTLLIGGLPVHPVSLDEAVDMVFSFINAHSPPRQVYSINPEIVMGVRKNPRLLQTLGEGDLNIPDGIGVVLGGRILGYNIPQRVAGYDLLLHILKRGNKEGLKVYLLGGKPSVAQKAGERIMGEYSGIQVVGTSHGYFSPEEEGEIIYDIRGSDAHLLLVAMGFPRQETFMACNADVLNVPVSMAVGGSLDGLAGLTNRAPLWVQKVHLEWLYRMLKDPRRWKRNLALFSFLSLILKEKVMGGQK